MKVLAIIGTRPEAIKMASVVHALRAEPDLEVEVCVTGQHREMVDGMLELFGIRPDFDLNVMRPSQSLTTVTTAVLEGLEPILRDHKPDWMLVQGDTTTVMAATMAAFYAKVAVGHVEAGLRTFDKYSPFPEEINRRVASVVADLHFAPTDWSAENLRREGVPDSNIFVTGNTVIDALQRIGQLDWDPAGSQLEDVPFEDKRIILVTAHRSENHGEGMREIAWGVRDVAERFADAHVVYPVHLNPRARAAAYTILSDVENITLCDPLEYHPLVWLLHRCHLVITDSGGLQEEASAAGCPVLVLRDHTERPEGVQAGVAKLIGADRRLLADEATRLLADEQIYRSMSTKPCPYGDGTAGVQIAKVLGDEARTAALPREHVYEQPVPAHPLDALLRSDEPHSGSVVDDVAREATADLSPEQSAMVRERLRRSLDAKLSQAS